VVAELRPRSVGEVLDVAVRLYRARFGPLMLVAIAAMLPVSLLSFFVLLSAQPDDFMVGITGEVAPVYDDETDVWTQVAASVVTILLSTLASAAVTAAATRIVADAYVGERETTGEAIRATARRFPAIIGLSIIVTVGVFVGTLLCVVPGLWLQAAWAVAVPVLILEGTGVFAALSRSFNLTKVRFWLAFGVVWLSQLLVAALAVGLSAGLDLAIRTSDGATAEIVAQSVADAIAVIITTPFVAAALVALYFDLRTRAEGFDVQMMIARLDARRAAGSVTA
jgi:hypothetical protein